MDEGARKESMWEVSQDQSNPEQSGTEPGAVNRDTGAALGKQFYLKMVISDFGNGHRISTFHRLKFLNGAKKK